MYYKSNLPINLSTEGISISNLEISKNRFSEHELNIIIHYF